MNSVTYLDEELTLRETAEMDFAYRRSRFSDTGLHHPGAGAVPAAGRRGGIRERMRALMERRRASQPLEMPSAGSTFKSARGGYAAALIDAAGPQGLCRRRGHQVSEKHAALSSTGAAPPLTMSCGSLKHISRRGFPHPPASRWRRK